MSFDQYHNTQNIIGYDWLPLTATNLAGDNREDQVNYFTNKKVKFSKNLYSLVFLLLTWNLVYQIRSDIWISIWKTLNKLQKN